VTLIQDINSDPGSALLINVLRIDLKKPGVKVVSALGQDTVIEPDVTKGREVVSKLVMRRSALIGINADFFPYTGDPLGLAIHGGELVSEPMDRAAVGITASGEVICDKVGFSGTLQSSSGITYPLGGINRQRGKNELVLYTPAYGSMAGEKDGVEVVVTLDCPVRVNVDVIATAASDPSLALGAVIPTGGAVISASGPAGDWLARSVRAGDKLTIRFDLKSEFGRSWNTVMEAVGGGPCLVKGGEVYVDAPSQKFKPSFYAARHPRTAAGVTATGELLLVTVDGRQWISRGVTLNEMAQIMKSFGAVDAINLDGGGSTTLSIKGIVSNSPSEGKERPVANALLVFADAVCPTTSALRFADPNPVMAASGEGRMISVVDDSTGQPVSEEVKKSIVWGTTGGIGFVNQEGWFVPVKVGTGYVVALVGDQRIVLPITVIAGKPTNISADIVPDPRGAPNRGQVDVKLTDLNGNACTGVAVSLSMTGGLADTSSMTTDEKGIASFAVTWDTTKEAANVTVSAAGMMAEAK
jgi:hypothetical protein